MRGEVRTVDSFLGKAVIRLFRLVPIGPPVDSFWDLPVSMVCLSGACGTSIGPRPLLLR